MRAIMAEQAGEPEVLVVREAPDPQPGPGELLVDAAAIGVNFIEIYQRSGVYPVDYPFTPGAEASGTVAAVGAGVDGFAVGDRIATAGATGTYAERFVVAAEQAAHVPSGVDLELAGALPLQGCTAHYLATSAATPQAGDTVLVHAGAGGVGLLLTQLLVARGVRVLTTASSDAKRRLSLDAGAAESFDYEGFADRARELTGGEGVAVVYDGVGRDTFDASLDALRVRGELVLFGGASGQVPPFDLQRLNAGGSLSITRPSLGHFMRTPEERAWRYGELFGALADDSLQVQVGARFALADAADAHRALAGRGTTGKLILIP
ncbi:quinone oxidoreductase family protein [Leucobacter soli]|uniref:Quinone oxidoreductase 1 n=1 Tax=Leucobacter soli TaxID=2812850 RepID=A0A916NVF0_9MICO|nr:quinone oxidoreductase [Leucobacter soli]CAG7606398.1 Quinone oxidoreductase 1 [Leucobacter soli]